MATLENICNGFWIPEDMRFTVHVDAQVLQKIEPNSLFHPCCRDICPPILGLMYMCAESLLLDGFPPKDMLFTYAEYGDSKYQVLNRGGCKAWLNLTS